MSPTDYDTLLATLEDVGTPSVVLEDVQVVAGDIVAIDGPSATLLLVGPQGDFVSSGDPQGVLEVDQ